MSNFVCGANEEDYHLANVNFDRDVKEPDHVFDIRDVVTGDPSPDGKGKLRDLPRHRSGPYFPVAHQVFRSDESSLP